MGLKMARAEEATPKEPEQCYLELYRCMTEKDLDALESLLDDSFVLVHMTGLRQDKQAFLRAIADGTLRYASAVHEAIHSETDRHHAELIEESRVYAAVFGGGWHTWRLRLRLQCICRDGKWQIGKTVASAC